MKNQDWIEKIPGCFGDVDVIFASHQMDAARAREMFKAAIDAEATMPDIIKAATDFMKTKEAGEAHIKEQVAKIKDLKI